MLGSKLIHISKGDPGVHVYGDESTHFYITNFLWRF